MLINVNQFESMLINVFRGFIAGMTPWSPGAVRPAWVNSGVFFAGVLRGLGETK